MYILLVSSSFITLYHIFCQFQGYHQFKGCRIPQSSSYDDSSNTNSSSLESRSSFIASSRVPADDEKEYHLFPPDEGYKTSSLTFIFQEKSPRGPIQKQARSGLTVGDIDDSESSDYCRISTARLER